MARDAGDPHARLSVRLAAATGLRLPADNEVTLAHAFIDGGVTIETVPGSPQPHVSTRHWVAVRLPYRIESIGPRDRFTLRMGCSIGSEAPRTCELTVDGRHGLPGSGQLVQRVPVPGPGRYALLLSLEAMSETWTEDARSPHLLDVQQLDRVVEVEAIP